MVYNWKTFGGPASVQPSSIETPTVFDGQKIQMGSATQSRFMREGGEHRAFRYSVTLLLGDTSTKVLFGAFAGTSTFVLYEEGTKRTVGRLVSIAAHPAET